MDFAKKQLEKYGWREGQGLGKNEDGIADAIKPKLKFDNTGVGHDHGAQFTNKWWETLFNNASNNIDVHEAGDKINLSLKSDPIEITTKRYSLKKNDRNALYGSFLKTSKLTEKGVEHYAVPVIHENRNNFTELTDEELFAACGGRTAHKGARHGLKLSGKLSRIKKQEKMLLKKMKEMNVTEDEDKIIKKMKKLQLQKERIGSEEINDNVEPVSDSSCSSLKKKKKKSRKNVSFNDTVLEYVIPNSENNDEGSPPIVEPNEVVNSDEGIEQDLEDNNDKEDDNHRSFEEPQFVVSDLSNAERRKLKKKKKKGKNTAATSKFIQSVQDDMMQNVRDTDECMCKKRKLNSVGQKFFESKSSQSDIESPERQRKKCNKKKKHKHDQKMRNIVMSLDNLCRISGDD